MRYLPLCVPCLAGSALGLAPSGPWDNFNFAPALRQVYPAAIFRTEGDVANADSLVGGDAESFATISGQDSHVTVDFGIEVGGILSANFGTSSPSSQLTLAFTESSLWARPHESDDSARSDLSNSLDGALQLSPPQGFWTQPAETLRGGFRFLTIATANNESSVEIGNVSVFLNFDPDLEDLRAYSGYFYAKDRLHDDEDFLTKLWYAGAYTIQTNIIPGGTARQWPAPPAAWLNNASGGVAGPILVDGAKRDRTVWPGDMGIAVPSELVSLGDLTATRNSLATMLATQNPDTGELHMSGPPLDAIGSDTYHAWTLIGTYNYHLFTDDTASVQEVWENYTKAVTFLESKVDYGVGLMNITAPGDWARQAGGGFSAPGNALLYHVLTTGSILAASLNDTELAAAYAANASSLKSAFNDAFWDDDAGLYRDNATTTLHPQDANSYAVLYNLTESTDQAERISAGMTQNWNGIGAIAPELPDTISPFISSFEIQAHFIANQPSRALDLIRREWGYMLYTNLSVQSTLLEGFTSNGSLGYRSNFGYDYDFSYTSHAHGWSTGPTSALTFYLLGLTITQPAGREWQVKPIVESGIGVNQAQGGFETTLGWFGANWTIGDGLFELGVSTPEGTNGTVILPNGEERAVEGGEHLFSASFSG